MKPADNVVTGTVEVVFTPDLPTDHLVFRLWPNGPRPAKAGARLDVTATRIGNGSAPGQRPDATTLTVPVELHAGQSVTAAVDFTLTLPRPVDDRISRTADAIRLGSFFPILSWEPGVGWATEPPTSGFAEASTVQAADFTATVTTPPGFDVLATGVPGPANGQWTAQAVGDFAMSVGHFRTASATTKQGTAVTVGVDAQVKDGPESYVRRIVAALEDYGNRFGPYPWPAYTMAVEPNLQGGIEYPMHVMQGPGTVGRTTPHEVAHQWFYGLVENNQGRDPFLDEGLASWAEARDENTLSRFVGLAVPVAGKGHAGEPMAFWESRQSAYYRSVYVQPVQALAALGPPELVDCALRLYVARNAYRIARPVDLLEALKVVFPNAPATLARYGIAA
ncbi:MAG: hypothetical protein QOK43_1509 [Acidimicrobiaceae bacterium]|nr:hypothetical protein [Acidimicrobiaceae bacterium]